MVKFMLLREYRSYRAKALMLLAKEPDELSLAALRFWKFSRRL